MTTASPPEMRQLSQSPDLYAQLKSLVVEQGLLERQPLYYTLALIRTFFILAGGIALLVLGDGYGLRLTAVLLFALAWGQVGLLMHDAGHRQIFRNKFANEATCLAILFLMGFCRSWWMEKHNRHHSNPNDIEKDPDLSLPVLAFTNKQAASKRSLYRFIVKHQATLLPALMLLEGLWSKINSARFLVIGELKFPLIERASFVLHHILYIGFLTSILGLPGAIIFAAVHYTLAGFYLASVFAPNHKGMPIVNEDAPFLTRQIVTARNLRSNPVVDFVYGGLNYQIEHHLFPTMPRNNLRKAKPIVEEFCQKHCLSYHETGFVQSWREIFTHLRNVSRSMN